MFRPAPNNEVHAGHCGRQAHHHDGLHTEADGGGHGCSVLTPEAIDFPPYSFGQMTTALGPDDCSTCATRLVQRSCVAHAGGTCLHSSGVGAWCSPTNICRPWPLIQALLVGHGTDGTRVTRALRPKYRTLDNPCLFERVCKQVLITCPEPDDCSRNHALETPAGAAYLPGARRGGLT